MAVRRTNSSTKSSKAQAARSQRGGTPAAAQGTSPQEATTQDRLERQREVGAEQAQARTEEALAARGDAFADGDTVFTAVSRNGLSHRRNGILFGADPVTVDTTSWTEAEKQRFFNDTILMIVPGQQLKARGARLVAEAGQPSLTGGSGENATPEMLAAAERGRMVRHPSSGSGVPVLGASSPRAAQDLEALLNEGNTE